MVAAPGRNFVAREVLGAQHVKAALFDGFDGVFVGQLRRRAVERGIGLDGELVPGNVLHAAAQGDVQILRRRCARLLRQAVHQIDIDPRKSLRLGQRRWHAALRAVVNAPQALQCAVIELCTPMDNRFTPAWRSPQSDSHRWFPDWLPA